MVSDNPKYPIITKSLYGDLWKIEEENKIMFIDQKNLEKYLEKNERSKKD